MSDPTNGGTTTTSDPAPADPAAVDAAPVLPPHAQEALAIVNDWRSNVMLNLGPFLGPEAMRVAETCFADLTAALAARIAG